MVLGQLLLKAAATICSDRSGAMVRSLIAGEPLSELSNEEGKPAPDETGLTTSIHSFAFCFSKYWRSVLL
jgi:hypothetical protein